MDLVYDCTAPSCCDAEPHPWDTFSIASQWAPNVLRCLIIGESPGEDAEKYFYNERRKVAVRTIMLRELYRHGLISQPTLRAFREGGFLFDHAIRCILPAKVVQDEARLANHYESPRAAAAMHLSSSFNKKSYVWIMGRIARNAAAVWCNGFPRDTLEISKPPYPCKIHKAPRFFVSRYLLHASQQEVTKIFTRLHAFLDQNSSTQCVACLKTEPTTYSS